MNQDRPFSDPTQPGRVVGGVEWWACDPYPTWYRWTDDGALLVLDESSGHVYVQWSP